MHKGLISLAVVLVLLSGNCFSQQECPKTTLDKLFGQTCTIGPLTFYFGSATAWKSVLDKTTGTYEETWIMSKIKFKPLVATPKVGFELSGFPDAVADATHVSFVYLDDFKFYISGETPIYKAPIHLRDYTLMTAPVDPVPGSHSYFIAASTLFGAAPDPFTYYGSQYDWQLSHNAASYEQQSQASIPQNGVLYLSVLGQIMLYADNNAQAQSDGAQFWYTVAPPKPETE